MESPNYVSGGYIGASRIVVLDNSADNTSGIQAGSLTVFEAGSNAAVATAIAAGTSTATLFQSDLAATATNRQIVGISMPGTDWPPINDSHITVGPSVSAQSLAGNLAAAPGEDLQVYGPGQYAMLELAGTVNAGQRVAPNYTSTSAADGRGVAVGAYASGSPQQYVGIALQNGVAGNKILVLVQPGVF